MEDMKAVTLKYLDASRDAVVWKVRGVPERELRMPRTGTGTNMLGLVKHLAMVEAEYFGFCLGRPWPQPLPGWAEGAAPNADMWATADESPEFLLDLYGRVRAWADDTLADLPLDAPARVPWWDPPETTVHRLIVHMVAETGRHAGHLDILRESVDGARGMLPVAPNLPEVDEDYWPEYVAELRAVADASG